MRVMRTAKVGAGASDHVFAETGEDPEIEVEAGISALPLEAIALGVLVEGETD